MYLCMYLCLYLCMQLCMCVFLDFQECYVHTISCMGDLFPGSSDLIKYTFITRTKGFLMMLHYYFYSTEWSHN